MEPRSESRSRSMCSTTIFSAHTDAVSCARQLFLMPAVQLRSIHFATCSRNMWPRDQGNDHASPRRRLHVPTHVARLDAPPCCLGPGRPSWAAPDFDRERNRGAKSFLRLPPRVESQGTRAYGG